MHNIILLKKQNKTKLKVSKSGLKGFEYRIEDLYLFRFNLLEPWVHCKSEIRSQTTSFLCENIFLISNKQLKNELLEHH